MSGVDFSPLLATRNDSFARYFIPQDRNCRRGGRLTGRYPLDTLPGRALRQPGGCAPLQDSAPSQPRPARWLITGKRSDLKIHISSPAQTLYPGEKQASVSCVSSQERPGGRNAHGEGALTYVFARYTHGSPLLHLAGLHNYTHHDWVTRVENELREYLHLARKYCYVPGR